MTTAFIAGTVRTPFAFARKGPLADVRPDDLSADVIAALLAGTGAPADAIEDVVWGCAFPEGEQGLNIARVAALGAGLPETTAGMTVNRWCGSSMQAIQIAAGMVAMGSGEAFIAGGVESMSRVPMYGVTPSPPPSWDEDTRTYYLNMGLTAERVAAREHISRDAQDAFALESHRKAAAARADGRLGADIVPIDTAGHGTVAHDGCIRDTSRDALAGLKPAFLDDGTVTAGSSSPMTDGAAATLIASEAFCTAHDLTPLARIDGFAVSGCDPAFMGLGPIEASGKALRRAGRRMVDIDIVEMNEAFAAQAEACRRALQIDPARLNIDGGAIALGHPLGATGARLVGKAASLLRREGATRALATQCIGGGMGIAMVLEAA